MTSEPKITNQNATTASPMRIIEIDLEDWSELRHTRRNKVYQCMVQTCGYASLDALEFTRHDCGL